VSWVRRAIIFVVLALAAFGMASAQDASSPSLMYKVRLFWQQVPPAIEIAPLIPFRAANAPSLQLHDGRQLMLRAPLPVTVKGSRLLLGDRFTNDTQTLVVTGLLRLRVPGGSWGQLPGVLRVWVEDGELQAEATLHREDYVRAVLAGEAGGISEPEALKAIAVAIRSYAFTLSNRHQSEGFHFCDTTHCQDLRLVDRGRLIDTAVEETANELLWRDGAPVQAWHHADSGGHTEDARAVWGKEAPAWMRGQQDPWSNKHGRKPWESKLRVQQIAQALAAEGYPPLTDAPPRVLTRLHSGRAAQVEIGGRRLPASTFRFVIGRQLGWNHLRSDLYEIYDEGEYIRVEGRGAGHGVGLSQVGAIELAKSGKSYREILAFYYHGARVGVQAQDIQWTLLSRGLLRFQFAASAVDSTFPPLVERELRRIEGAVGLRLSRPLTIRVYPDIDTFRNHSANAGWVAAGTRMVSESTEIVFQPLELLRRHNTLALLVRHELAHALVLQQASTELPRWLHEGLAHWLARGTSTPRHNGGKGFASFQELDEALLYPDLGRYEEAAALASQLVREAVRVHGTQAVLAWVRNGLPKDDHVLLRILQQPRQP
jgi:stage II sporulation protein D